MTNTLLCREVPALWRRDKVLAYALVVDHGQIGGFAIYLMPRPVDNNVAA